MNILYEHHDIEMIKQWKDEDAQEVIDYIEHTRWLIDSLETHSHNTEVRKGLMKCLEETNFLIKTLKEEFKVNYGSTYKLLST